MKAGRPRKPEAERLTEVLRVRATKDEADAAWNLARRLDTSLSELLHVYLRRLLEADAIDVAPKCRPLPNARMLAGVVIH
jgi:hypothetical protein